jgi:hypothetical protein
MNPRFARIRNHPILFSLLAGLLLFAAQTAAQMHSVEHLFHKTVDTCATYHSVEHHKPGVFANPTLLTFDGEHIVYQGSDYRSPCTPVLKTWQSRAPPVSYPV